MKRKPIRKARQPVPKAAARRGSAPRRKPHAPTPRKAKAPIPSSAPRRKRFEIPKSVVYLVWIRAAGHCEQCGADLTVDLRSGTRVKWGQAAHIAPASVDGPRTWEDYTAAEAARLSKDPDNLVLLCPSDHVRVDRAPTAYPIANLKRHHAAHLAQIRHAAQRGETQRAQGVIILGQHFATENTLRPRDLLDAMLSEGLWAEDKVVLHVLPSPGRAGRDALYWQSIERSIDEHLEDRVAKLTSRHGDPLNLCVAALADIPSLIRVGRRLGDRSNRVLYSPHREHVLHWPDVTAAPPAFTFDFAGGGGGPIALMLSLSARIPERDVRQALPDARIATFTTPQPHYGLVQNRSVIHAFRNALQVQLSRLEAETDQPIHVFAAIPAALAVEFGALLSTQHAHRYLVYDREGGNAFVPAMELEPRRPSPAPDAAASEDRST